MQCWGLSTMIQCYQLVASVSCIMLTLLTGDTYPTVVSHSLVFIWSINSATILKLHTEQQSIRDGGVKT